MKDVDKAAIFVFIESLLFVGFLIASIKANNLESIIYGFVSAINLFGLIIWSINLYESR